MSLADQISPRLCAEAVVIGGGPAGLMAAEQLLAGGFSVALYDAMPSVGRKFLLAGVGGMNITHAEPRAAFNSHYYEAEAALAPCLAAFDADALRAWVQALGIETFVGSSGKVFPSEMKAAPLLRAWLHRLKAAGLQLYTRHQWQGWTPKGALIFQTAEARIEVDTKVLVLALGGASWSRLGSNGAWQPWLAAHQVKINPLKPANCAFIRPWSEHFSGAGLPVKAIAGWVEGEGAIEPLRGELLLKEAGLEGSLVYRLSAQLREQLLTLGRASLYLDLVPDKSVDAIAALLKRSPKGRTLAKLLTGSLGFSAAKRQLFFECINKADWGKPEVLAPAIKRLEVVLHDLAPMDDAISCAGGIAFSSLDAGLMLKPMPGVFCAGEMLDWEAPTGGYLLTACFATGRWAGNSAAQYLVNQ